MIPSTGTRVNSIEDFDKLRYRDEVMGCQEERYLGGFVLPILNDRQT